ncbi:glycoside hydrolase family 11 protein [Jidongwangia harbinensis]|uniref:glycoside hydrolase family 11 protein n=1 Tax=Jidongwangia harbinensis TaxID=2878561 RepID=UPI001CD93BF2|nr:glycoside hydrolase family 11 protein [Jidongwangia harbinensis]MCA2217585.1 glycoside hydrolase family 11 protein [Jidongwangia harbinensis]
MTLTLTGTALPADAGTSADGETTITTNQRGTHDGCFYWFWQDVGDASMTLKRGGYSSRWSDVGNWIGGKGWETGGPRTFSYSGTFEPEGNGYLAVFGTTTDPYTEYYIVENWGTFRPDYAAFVGTVTSEGGTYDVYRERANHSVTFTFWRYWSVRQEKRTGGTINTEDHFDAWARAGMEPGTHDFMVMATEGYRSIGSSDITVDCATAEPQRRPAASLAAVSAGPGEA